MKTNSTRKQYPMANVTNYVDQNSNNNTQYYQIVPIINNKPNSMHVDQNINNLNSFNYITPTTSPLKIQTTPITTPLRDNSMVPYPRQTHFLCKTTEKRNNDIFVDNDQNIMKALMEKNKQLLLKERDYLQRIDYLSKKVEILLKENQSLNSIINELGQDLIETKQKLSYSAENGNNEGVLSQNNDELELRIQTLSKENEKLINMIEIQNQEENSLKFLEGKIDCLLLENNKLNGLLKKEREISNEYKRRSAEIGKNNNLEYENKILEYKMQELQKKLEVIFEDNDKLEKILKEHEQEYTELKEKYEYEVQKNSHQIIQINELLIKIKDLKEALKLKRSEEFEKELEKIIEEKNILQEKNTDLEKKVITLIEDNIKLNDCLADNLNHIEEVVDNERKSIKQIDEIERASVQKIEVLLAENERLQAIVESTCDQHEKLNNFTEQNQRLINLLAEKEKSEIFWKNKYLDLETKIKNLL